MYNALFEKKDNLIEEYEEAEKNGDAEKMKKIAAEIEEIQIEINTEFF